MAVGVDAQRLDVDALCVHRRDAGAGVVHQEAGRFEWMVDHRRGRGDDAMGVHVDGLHALAVDHDLAPTGLGVWRGRNAGHRAGDEREAGQGAGEQIPDYGHFLVLLGALAGCIHERPSRAPLAHASLQVTAWLSSLDGIASNVMRTVRTALYSEPDGDRGTGAEAESRRMISASVADRKSILCHRRHYNLIAGRRNWWRPAMRDLNNGTFTAHLPPLVARIKQASSTQSFTKCTRSFTEKENGASRKARHANAKFWREAPIIPSGENSNPVIIPRESGDDGTAGVSIE